MSLPAVNAFQVAKPPADNCFVCLHSLKNGEVVMDHEGFFPNRHMCHQKCMKQMHAIHGLCGVCKHPINANSLFSLKERRAISLSAFKNNALLGMVQALVLGTCLHTLTKYAAKKLLLQALIPVGVLALVGSIFARRCAQSFLEREINEYAVFMGMIVGSLAGLMNSSLPLPSILSSITMVGALTSGIIAYKGRWET